MAQAHLHAHPGPDGRTAAHAAVFGGHPGGSVLSAPVAAPSRPVRSSRKGKGKKRATSVFAGLLNAAINANGTGGADAVVDVQSVLRPKAGTTLDKSYGVTLTLAAVATFILVLATAVILTLAFVRLEWGLIALMVLLIAAPIMAYVSLVDASRGGRPGCVTCGLISVVLAVLYAIGFTIYTAAAITYIPESCAADPLCRADGAAEMDPPEVAGIPNIYYVMMTWFPLAWAIVAGIVYIWLLRDAQTSQERIISNARKATTAQQLPLGV